ncbi:MAG: hypothetical protein OSB46_14725 [Alphaproteobacteria bacterium]|nr:hypothetical protein [Alphaproteobacteria bacterium]
MKLSTGTHGKALVPPFGGSNVVRARGQSKFVAGHPEFSMPITWRSRVMENTVSSSVGSVATAFAANSAVTPWSMRCHIC